MRQIIFIVFVAIGCSVNGQGVQTVHIFSDTSLYFIQQRDTAKLVNLSPEELGMAEILFLKAVKEFNEAQQQFANPDNGSKRKKKSVLQIDPGKYLFRLSPEVAGGQKTVYISATCKGFFKWEKSKAGGRKQHFIDGSLVSDGGSCFLYVRINLGTGTYSPLAMNGEG